VSTRAATASIALESRGGGPALVLLHTLGSDRRIWDPVMPLLERERTVVTVDMPGFGDSPPLDDGVPVTAARLAAAIAERLAADGIERPHVAGNSLGGWVALELAVSGAARTVTAIAPAGLWPHPLAPRRDLGRRAARLFAPAAGALVRHPGLRRVALLGVVAHPDRVPPAATAHLVRSYGRSPGFPAANRAMRASRFDRLAEIDVPVTLAWAQHDRLVARLRSVPPSVRSVTLHGCGHLPTWDDPQQVARVLLDGSSERASGARMAP
jgi:pimeloyl-ACP methyl ester carboxylesterase